MNDQAVTVGAFLKAVKGCERLSLFDFDFKIRGFNFRSTTGCSYKIAVHQI